VTQATISRDMRELGLEKTHDLLGRPRYVLPDGVRRTDPRETLTTVLAQFGHGAVSAQNIVVVRSELGSAPAIARALDRLEHPKIVGTLAGDDTCLVIAKDAGDAREVARELAAAIR
jgi:transcriptional regulator of arginine metabolism